jgi:hypothetical protein
VPVGVGVAVVVVVGLGVGEDVGLGTGPPFNFISKEYPSPALSTVRGVEPQGSPVGPWYPIRKFCGTPANPYGTSNEQCAAETDVPPVAPPAVFPLAHVNGWIVIV